SAGFQRTRPAPGPRSGTAPPAAPGVRDYARPQEPTTARATAAGAGARLEGRGGAGVRRGRGRAGVWWEGGGGAGDPVRWSQGWTSGPVPAERRGEASAVALSVLAGGLVLGAGVGADHPQVPLAVPLRHRAGGRLRAALRSLGAGRLAHRVGQRLQVVAARPAGAVGGQPDDLPAARGGAPLGVHRAQVVAVRLDIGRERTEHGRGVGVDIGEREDCWLSARGSRAASDNAHGDRPYSFPPTDASRAPPCPGPGLRSGPRWHTL